MSAIELDSEPPKKKSKSIDEDSSCTKYILTVQQDVGAAENLSTKKLESSISCELSTSDLTPAQQNAIAVYSDPNSNDSINQVWFTTKGDKAYMKNKKGHVWRTGMWSKEEIKILEDNIKSYCETEAITDPASIIFNKNKDERKDFYRIIAKGLNRPLFSVYRRVIRMYDNKNYIGKYSQEEMDKLKELRAKHGKDWQAIGQAMGRSSASIKDKCRLMKDNCNQGKWSPEEEKRLAEAVYDLAEAVPGEIVYSGLSWSAVASRVATRSEKQCRAKWLYYLNWKEVGGTEWTREDDVFLVTKVCSLNIPDESAIDWAVLSEGWPSVRSPQWLRGKWWNLKRQIPSGCVKTFQEQCDYLYKQQVQNVSRKEQNQSSSLSESEDTESKITAMQTLPSSNIPICTEVSITSGLLSSSTMAVTDDSMICMPAVAIQLGSNETVYLTPMQQLSSATGAEVGELVDGNQVIVEPLSPEILESVNRYSINTNDQIIINAPVNQVESLQSIDDVAEDCIIENSNDNRMPTCDNEEIISAVNIKSDSLLQTQHSPFNQHEDSVSSGEDVHNSLSSKLITDEIQSCNDHEVKSENVKSAVLLDSEHTFSHHSNEVISHEEVNNSTSSKLILADPMLGSSQESPEITVHVELNEEVATVSEESSTT